MGGGTYSSSLRSVRAESMGYYTKSTNEIFTERSINNAMDPHGLTIRESRDSDEHPNSVAIIVALDLTGSMGSIPSYLVKDGLPKMVSKIIQNGVPDPQILFTGVGDHECDKYPLQVGQFESSDELLDHWLTKIHLEGGGGANAGESYLLAWYLAAFHTSIDCFEKRNEKGFLFTIGDEPTLTSLPTHSLKTLLGEGQYSDMTHKTLLEKASEKYHVYHIHIKETRAGSFVQTIDGWKELLGQNLLVANHHSEVSDIISDVIINNTKNKSNISSEPSIDDGTILL